MIKKLENVYVYGHTYIGMYVHTHIDIHTYVLFLYQSIHTRNYEFIPISLISIQHHELQSSFLPF